MIHYDALGAGGIYDWPGTTLDSNNIDTYGEVVLTVPEFPTMIVPALIALVVLVFTGIKQRKR